MYSGKEYFSSDSLAQELKIWLLVIVNFRLLETIFQSEFLSALLSAIRVIGQTRGMGVTRHTLCDFKKLTWRYVLFADHVWYCTTMEKRNFLTAIFKGAGGLNMVNHGNWFYRVFWQRTMRSSAAFYLIKILVLAKVFAGRRLTQIRLRARISIAISRKWSFYKLQSQIEPTVFIRARIFVKVSKFKLLTMTYFINYDRK